MKSIYNQDDLRCNQTGNQINYEGEEFFKSMLEKYPDYDPREIVGLLLGAFNMISNRRILELRQAGLLIVKDQD